MVTFTSVIEFAILMLLMWTTHSWVLSCSGLPRAYLQSGWPAPCPHKPQSRGGAGHRDTWVGGFWLLPGAGLGCPTRWYELGQALHPVLLQVAHLPSGDWDQPEGGPGISCEKACEGWTTAQVHWVSRVVLMLPSRWYRMAGCYHPDDTGWHCLGTLLFGSWLSCKFFPDSSNRSTPGSCSHCQVFHISCRKGTFGCL